jgi:hypothetical protein
MRRLSMWRWLPLWRRPLRVRLARLRRLRLRRVRLLLAMGPLPHLLSGTHGGTTTRRFGRLDSYRAGYSFFCLFAVLSRLKGSIRDARFCSRLKRMRG